MNNCFLILGLLFFLASINVANAEQLPKAISMEPAIYPAEAKAAGVKGSVTIKFTIDDAGRVDSADVVKSSGSDLLDQAAIDAVMNYRFEKPNFQKEGGVPTYTTVIEFNEATTRSEAQSQNVNAKIQPEIEPKVLETVPTIYPSMARIFGIEGQVVLALQIDEGGLLIDAKVIKSSGHSSLDNAALETVKDYKFSPAVLNGKKVEATKNLSITFKLNGADGPTNTFQYIGTWEGILAQHSGPNLYKAAENEKSLRIVIDPQSGIGIFFQKGEKWTEISHGLFKIIPMGPQAVIVAVSSGHDSDGTWVEGSWFTLMYHDRNTVIAYWLHTVNNLDLPTSNPNSHWATSFSGVLNRIDRKD